MMSFQKNMTENEQNKIQIPPLDIMLVGVTGAGKSTTINALLGDNAAKIGYGVYPETKEIKAYKLNDYIRLWDTPGLGDSPEEDERHLKKISSYLNRPFMKDGIRYGNLIDIVLFVIDGSRRDLGVTYSLLNDTIFKNIESNKVLFAINQADMAMKGHHWDDSSAKPDETLSVFLDNQIDSVKRRIEEVIHQEIRRPMCYSASNKYNIDCLVNYVLENYSGQRKTVSSSATSDSSSRNLTSSYQSSNDDSIGDVIGNVVAAPLNGVAWGLEKVADFFDWLSLL
ncbi:Predicted GTPase [Treponema berlinense]|uniref:Predicted GTPase n=1 Tax=Treponema berlinense TaxID=225004 RepID=A0A1T4QT08_9SPIR|nr:GTPase [Treponema berlinense]SKA06892.1 Predicted GTPase [Treponema berlinense]